ncbi:hypothetical protein ACFOKJ_02535 [Vogesella amnigena]|uniref:Uncharacterized protein n=1 Tax=Vogesella amnigena TaxID=1507449 RepID=A0ABV7TQB2_9NEIS
MVAFLIMLLAAASAGGTHAANYKKAAVDSKAQKSASFLQKRRVCPRT